MLEEIAKADASTAWCLGQCGVCAMVAAYLDPAVADEIFDAPPGILAWGATAGEARAVPGGYRVNWRWRFSSGIRQASWIGAHVQIIEPDGKKRLKPDGKLAVRTIVFPVASATLHDVWDVVGLKGTGTDIIRSTTSSCRRNSPRCATMPAAARGRAALQDQHQHVFGWALRRSPSASRARRSMPRSRRRAARHSRGLKAGMRDNNAVQAPSAATKASLRAAHAYLYSTAAEVWRELDAGDADSRAPSLALRLATTWTIHQSAAVVDTAYHMAGATAVFSAKAFERRFRDMHAIAQQIQSRDTHYEDAGRVILPASLHTPPTTR